MTYNLPSGSPGAFTLAPCAEGANPFLRIGGVPRLPETLEWPQDSHGRPLHYYGAIDFAETPKTFGGSDRTPTPEIPGTGTCLIFLNMLAHAADELDVAILCSENSDRMTEDGALPDDLGSMSPSSEYVDQNMLSACGRMFVRSVHVLTPAASTVRPGKKETPAPVFHSLDAVFKAVIENCNSPLDQAGSFQLAKDIVTAFHDVTRNELDHWHGQDVDARALRKLESLLEREQAKSDEISINGAASAMDRLRFGNANLPKPSDNLDDLFISWMRYIRANCKEQNAGAKLTDAEMTWFEAACDRIVELENDTSPPALRCLNRMRNHDLTGADVTQHIQDILAERLTRADPTVAKHKTKPLVFPGFKLFGTSDGATPSDWDDGEHILLIQLADAFGPNFLKIDLLLQLWIRAEDLAQGRFDRIGIAGEMAQ